jgi:hypothetical protein
MTYKGKKSFRKPRNETEKNAQTETEHKIELCYLLILIFVKYYLNICCVILFYSVLDLIGERQHCLRSYAI